MMLPTDATEVTEPHLRALIAEQVPEGRAVDYKQDLYGGREQDKVEFLADIISFANAGGGHLILGMTEDNRLPTGLPGIACVDWDREIGRLVGWAASGVEPRIPRLTMHPVPLTSDSHALVVAIPASFVGPHRLRANDLHRFYGRTAHGKYLLDIQEVRALFAQSTQNSELLRRYRAERLALIMGGETPIPLAEGPILVFHTIPVAALTGGLRVDPVIALDLDHDNGRGWLRPLGASGWNHAFNFDGVVTMTAGAYTQLARDGMLECASSTHLDRGSVPSTALCDALVSRLGGALEFYRALEIPPPFAAIFSVVAAQGLRFAAGGGIDPTPLARDTLLFPAIPIEDPDADAATVLRPVFDALWQTFGLERCPLYDTEGRYRGRGR